MGTLRLHPLKTGNIINKMKNSNKKIWVSASDAGRAAFCGHFLELKYSHHKVSKEAEQNMLKGNIAHQEFNELAEDKRCFVASHLYGADHINTEKLRQYRDSTLLKTNLGKIAVKVYYRLSPWLVQLARHSPFVHSFLKKTVDYCSLKIREKYNG